ncbi:MAG: hypothetical protein M3416_01605 [Acidobacteriota bacterium]|nr:hypothetical protein [Acidobacteriota bacterium]
MSYISLFIVFVIALLGLLSKSVKADEKGNNAPAKYGSLALTGTGKVITALLCVSFLLSLFTMYQSSKEAKEIERMLNALRLERELSGVEISFKPSTEHWSKIAQVLDKIEPPAPDFPYSASTITAERVGDSHWRLDFTEIKRPAGTVRPGPVSTNQPGGKVFEEVINSSLIELLIIWSNGLTTEISPRGNYPSSVTVSQDRIVYTFRPPTVRLNLASLNDHLTITFRGQQYPPRVRVRSLDRVVIFDETIDLSWEERPGNTHVERMMPYISGPHSLDIFFKNFPG